jgi:nucleotide-binding universal stress UspA family protein
MIVVGVDDLDNGDEVLRFAIDEARFRKAPLRVICAWGLPIRKWGDVRPPYASVGGPRQRAQEVVAEAAQIAQRLAGEVQCEFLALEGEAGAVLVAQSSEATMLVLGRHGHGVADTLLGSAADVAFGSVSHRVVREAHCPVVVVPTRSPPD